MHYLNVCRDNLKPSWRRGTRCKACIQQPPGGVLCAALILNFLIKVFATDSNRLVAGLVDVM